MHKDIKTIVGVAAGVLLGLALIVVLVSWPAMLVFGAFLGYQGIDGPGFFETLFGLFSLSILGNTFFPSNMRNKNAS